MRSGRDWLTWRTWIQKRIDEYDSFDIRAFASAIKFHSPYQEVRAVVDPEDDPTIPVETFRAYFLAIIWSVIGSGFNEFFFTQGGFNFTEYSNYPNVFIYLW